MVTKREEKAAENFLQRKQKKPLKWENMMEKCPNCKSTNLERLNLFQGMNRKNSNGNFQMVRCKDCGKERFVKL